MKQEPEVPVAEWLAEATRRFGADTKLWKFECPICGNVQTPTDFNALGVEPQLAYQECIGRHLPNRASEFATKPAKDGTKSPCDYAAYGLFHSGYRVISETGKAVFVFPFAEVA